VAFRARRNSAQPFNRGASGRWLRPRWRSWAPGMLFRSRYSSSPCSQVRLSMLSSADSLPGFLVPTRGYGHARRCFAVAVGTNLLLHIGRGDAVFVFRMTLPAHRRGSWDRGYIFSGRWWTLSSSLQCNVEAPDIGRRVMSCFRWLAASCSSEVDVANQAAIIAGGRAVAGASKKAATAKHAEMCAKRTPISLTID